MSKAKPECPRGCDPEGWIFIIVKNQPAWVRCPDPECSGPREEELEAAGQARLL